MSNNIQNSFTRILLVAVMAMACFAMNAQRLSHTNENKRGTIEQQIANAPINYNNQKVDALLNSRSRSAALLMCMVLLAQVRSTAQVSQVMCSASLVIA